MECGPPVNNPDFSCENTKNEALVHVDQGSGCVYRVRYRSTVCTDNATGDVFVYIEEEQIAVQVTSPPGIECPVSPELIEQLYSDAVQMEMEGHSDLMSSCGGTGSQSVSSEQVKVECQKLCSAPGFPGETNVSWIPCAMQQSCCIKTLHWCLDSQGNAVSSLQSRTRYGTCTGPLTPSCEGPLGSTTYCYPDRCN